MRPSPQELVDGVRRILKDVVEPELTSEHARQRLSEARAVLAQVDWDDAGLRLAARTAALRATLTEFHDAGLPVPTGVLEGTLGTSYAVLDEQHRACAAALADLLPVLEEAAVGDAGLTSARSRLLAVLLDEASGC